MIAGRLLMAALGVFFWVYTLRPELPVIRSLPYFWRGNLPPSMEWRVVFAIVGSLLIVAALFTGPLISP